MSRIRSLSARVLREPLAQFLLLGLLIFLVASLRGPEDEPGRIIRISERTREHLAGLYEAQFGVPPDAGTLEYLVENHLREEVLFREAMRLGLDQGDEIIRRRLVQKMEFLVNGNSAVPVPDDEALRAYHARHADRFTLPPTVSFTHRYFRVNGTDEDAQRVRALAALEASGAGPDKPANNGGDPFPMPMEYTGLDRLAARQAFGDTPLVDALFSTAPGRWTGPWRSGYGWHLLRIEERHDAQLIPFEEARDDVIQAYANDVITRENQAAMERLLAGYTVIRTGDGER